MTIGTFPWLSSIDVVFMDLFINFILKVEKTIFNLKDRRTNSREVYVGNHTV